MRLSALIGLLAIAVCANAADERQPAANASHNSEADQVQTFEFHVLKPPAKSPRKFVLSDPVAKAISAALLGPKAKPPLSRPPIHVGSSTDCYKMRTFQVQSDPDRWDVTRPSGYSECLAASKVGFKHMDAHSR